MVNGEQAQPDQEPRRCAWVGDDPLYRAYHDLEWGVPVYDDRALFELLMLEGFQAGLSWITVLRKRENFRAAFAGFEPERIAVFDDAEVEKLLANTGIIRHRGKIEATVAAARIWLEMRQAGESFSEFLWSFAGGVPQRNRWRSSEEVPASTSQSARMSRALKTRGFRFCGPTICYAFMQASGMVNDHTTDCFRFNDLN